MGTPEKGRREARTATHSLGCSLPLFCLLNSESTAHRTCQQPCRASQHPSPRTAHSWSSGLQDSLPEEATSPATATPVPPRPPDPSTRHQTPTRPGSSCRYGVTCGPQAWQAVLAAWQGRHELHWQGADRPRVTSPSLALPWQVIYWCLSGMNRSKAARWQAINQPSNQGWQQAKETFSSPHIPS